MEERVYEAVLYSEYRSRQYKERRVRQLRRRFILFALTVVLVVLLAVSYCAILSHATAEGEMQYKYFTSIQVQYGDSLWSIAEEYITDGDAYASAADYVDEVMAINHLRDEKILAGQYLIVPYYSPEFK